MTSTRISANSREVKQPPVWKKILKIALITLGVFLVAVVVAAGGYVYNNLNYYKGPLQATWNAGFIEKQVTLPDGDVLNYGEGPDNGPALLLIHGQVVSWEDYAPVLPELSKHYHIFAVDCHGHGESAKNPAKYSAQAMGRDFVWFIENVIGEPAVISGHSSGGLLTAWLAANSPQNVQGIVLEDPPFFTTESGRVEKTFAWIDSMEPIHRYLRQTEEKDFTLFYLKNSYWITFFGDGKNGLIQYATDYRAQHPSQKLEFFFLPPSINTIFRYTDLYDPRFGDTFYDASWNRGFDHAESLARINCPSVMIHASWSYDKNGILLAALSGDDAARVHTLIKNNTLIDVVSGHDIHFEKPQEFTKILIDFLDQLPSDH